MTAALLRARVRSHRATLVVAWINLWLTAIGLCALQTAGAATAEDGLRSALDGGPAVARVVSLSVATDGTRLPLQDADVRRLVDRHLPGTSADAAATSVAWGLPGAGSRPDLLQFAWLSGIERHARLVSGSWPLDTGGDVQIAVPRPIATARSWSTG